MDRAQLEQLTVDELQERAKAVGIEGRSAMNKDELVDALAAFYRDNPPPEPRIG